MNKNEEQNGVFRSLQALRGLAALLVVFFHAGVLTDRRFGWTFYDGFFKFGWAGVDFFFALSGFIIFCAHRDSFCSTSEIRRYFAKRFIRVVPVYWIWTFISVAGFIAAPNLGEGFERTLSGILTSLFFIPQSHSPIVRAGWSLNYEVWFYILFGLALFMGKRAARAGILIWCLVLAGGWFLPSNTFSDFYLNPLQLEFIFGIAAGWLACRHRVAPRTGALIFCIGGLLFVLGANATDRTFAAFGQLYAVVGAGLPSLVIIYGAVCIERSVQWPRFFTALGDASYSIYLSHSLFLSGFARIFALKNNLAVSTDIVLSVTAGYLSYVLIEKPVLNLLKERLQNRQHAARAAVRAADPKSVAL